MKTHLARVRDAINSRTAQVAAAATVALMPVLSFADDTASGASAGAAQAFSALSSEASTMEGYAYPVMISVTGGLIGIGIVKKFMNRSA